MGGALQLPAVAEAILLTSQSTQNICSIIMFVMFQQLLFSFDAIGLEVSAASENIKFVAVLVGLG